MKANQTLWSDDCLKDFASHLTQTPNLHFWFNDPKQTS